MHLYKLTYKNDTKSYALIKWESFNYENTFFSLWCFHQEIGPSTIFLTVLWKFSLLFTSSEVKMCQDLEE